MNDDAQNDYLWDGTGDRDENVARLEHLLAPLAHRGRLPALPARQRRGLFRAGGSRVPAWLTAAAAAAAVVLGFGLWFALGGIRGAWTVQQLAGRPAIDGVTVEGDGTLRRGGRLVTDAVSRARVEVGRIGRVDVDPETTLELVASGAREHRVSLERGTIHARIWAPPRFFFVNTPFAEAIDLGCAFTLRVDDSGAGLLRVTHGWVQFSYDGREAFIPQGAVGATRPRVGPGTPRFEDAPSGYGEALATLDFGSADASVREAALDFILTHARRQDALTLWHLLSRGSPAERARVYERLLEIAPPPGGVTREVVLAGNRDALMKWWDSFRFEGTSFWSRLKKRF